VIGSNTTRQPRENAKREQKLSLVNAPGLFICKISYAIASRTPQLSLPFSGRFLPDLDRRRKPRGPFYWRAGCWIGLLGNSEPLPEGEPAHKLDLKEMKTGFGD
jgi:hypothetical protein